MYYEPKRAEGRVQESAGTFRIDTSVTGDFVVATRAKALAEDRVDPEAEREARAACSTGGCGCSRFGPGPTKGAWMALALGTAGGFGLLIGLFLLFGR